MSRKTRTAPEAQIHAAENEGRGIAPAGVDERDERAESFGKFLSLPNSNLLIKGLPGTGKTILALTLLRWIPAERRAYISTRVAKAKVSTQLPQQESESPNEFVDIRLGDAASVLEYVAGLGSETKGMTVVLDSWDALAKELDPTDRLKAEKSLTSFALGDKTHLIFVSEEPGQTTIDYLVDGVLELVMGEENGRTMRELVARKLRGASIPQVRSVFTLQNGRFSLFGPYKTPDYSKVTKFIPRKDIGGAYSLGSEQFDKLLGGLIPGHTLMLEYDPDVPYAAVRSIELTAILNFLALRRSVVLAPLPGTNATLIESILTKSLDIESVKERFRLIGTAAYATHRSGKGVVWPKPARLFAVTHETVSKLKKKSADSCVLFVRSMSTMENLFASDLNRLLENVTEGVTHTQLSHGVNMYLVQSDSPIKTRLLSMCSESVRLSCKNGTVVLTGEKPYTAAHALENTGNPVVPTLTPIL